MDEVGAAMRAIMEVDEGHQVSDAGSAARWEADDVPASSVFHCRSAARPSRARLRRHRFLIAWCRAPSRAFFIDLHA